MTDIVERPYMTEPWFAMLKAAVAASDQSAAARALGVSPASVNQVVRGKGNYGNGKASTAGIAQRVLDTFGQWACPFLSDGGAERCISAAQCRDYAHRDAPTSSPRDLAHWRSCQTCPNKKRSAPPVHRPVVPRKASEHNPGDVS
ncbi:MAG: hypothetical protein E6Q67_09530 [Roseateles sp.]|nr:MAG: hypothetical protein E6Q67_09530 [Roseateles sp.]